MLKASPKGTVPVLILNDGSVIDESIGIMLWALEQADPKRILKLGKGTELIKENDGQFKFHLDRFKYSNRHPYENKAEHHTAIG